MDVESLLIQIPTRVTFEELKEMVIKLAPDRTAATYACKVGMPKSAIGRKYVTEILSQSYQSLLRKNPRIYYQNIYRMGYISLQNAETTFS